MNYNMPVGVGAGGGGGGSPFMGKSNNQKGGNYNKNNGKGNDDPSSSAEEGEVEEGQQQVVEFDGSIKSSTNRSDADFGGGAGGGGGVAGAAASRQQKPSSSSSQQGQAQVQVQQVQHYRPSTFGLPVTVLTTGQFPRVGSTLGPYFCLGQLGKGTFSSIHKCINLAYATDNDGNFYSNNGEKKDALAAAAGEQQQRPRLAAAKVELTTFAQSGVLESEATILHFLHRTLPPDTVPLYMGHYRSTIASRTAAAITASAAAATVAASAPPPPAAEVAKDDAAAAALAASTTGESGSSKQQVAVNGVGGATPAGAAAAAPPPPPPPPPVAAALMMEYLPGRDMHQLRENVMAGRPSRRIDLEDAIALTADVMLPLLQRMHGVGIVHRDVKPSNVVSKGGGGGKVSNKDGSGGSGVPVFCVVDFGLSKSILVPEDSPHADREHHFPGRDWLRPQNYTGRACYRKERERADFRGTSMYASLRVHQLRDYCPRDDLYSLLYVFCDLVSGGLPWMSYAANRDRAMCQKLKERAHGDKTGSDETELLLMGDVYHIVSFRRERQQASGDTSSSSRPVELPEPLSMSSDPRRVGLLRRAFDHLSKLNFWDQPDYNLIHHCIKGFSGKDQFKPSPVPRIDWNVHQKLSERWRSNLLGANRYMPKGSIHEDSDPLDEDIFDELEDSAEAEELEKDDLAVLPVELRFRIAQMEYHANRPSSVPPQIALRDWMKIALPLLYGEWDTPKYEGRHRTSSDGLKRDLYLSLLQRCREWGIRFGDFQSRDCHPQLGTSERRNCAGSSAASGAEPESKKRKSSLLVAAAGPYAVVSRALYGLSEAIKDEEAKKSAAQATRLSFA